MWVMVVIGFVGISAMACSGTVSGTDLTNAADGGSGGNGGGGGGLLGGGTAAGNGSNNNGGSTTSTSSSSSSGTGTSTQGTQPSANGGVCGSGETTGSAACDQCLDPQCCTSIKACDANAECVALFNCAKGCNGDRECGQECRAQHPSGDADLQTFIACVQKCGACQ
jgi:hypothetical protein